MSSLFGSGTKEIESSTDPFKNMPDWQKEAIQGMVEDGSADADAARAIAKDLAENPREIVGLNETEKGAKTDVEEAGIMSDEKGQAAWDASQAANYDAATFDGGYEKQGATDVGRGYENAEFDGGYTGDRLTEALGGKDFNSDYTDSVVDTTLAGMDRQAQREQMRRESQNAAIGGTSNSRTATGNAIADQLTGLNMAQQEASLRDAAHKFGVDKDFERAKMFDSSDQFGSTQNLEEQKATDASAQFGADFDADFNMEEAKFQDSMNQFDSDQTLEEQKLADSSNQFSADFELDKANDMDAMASSGLDRDMTTANWMKGYGENEREIDQQQKDANRTAAADAHTWMSGQVTAANAGITAAPTGTTTTQEVETPSLASQIIGGAAALTGVAGMIPSDINIKTGIQELSGLEALRGVKPSSYEYRSDAPSDATKRGRTAGLMAQDLTHIPGAVERGNDGIYRVDPYPVLATVVAAVQDLDRRTRTN